MTVPQVVLLAFALWTLLVPLGAIAYYRWSRILRGLEPIHAFRADRVDGADWYRRAMRAHANCVENLPVLGAIVVVLSLWAIDARWLDVLAVSFLVARVAQSCVHLGFRETRRSVALRSACFVVQVVCMLGLGASAIAHQLARS